MKNNNKKISTIFYLLLCVIPMSVYPADQSEDSSDSDSIIVVSGSKVEENSEEAVEKVQVITADEIKKNGAKTLSEAVKGVSGIVVTGHPTDSITMQGFDSEYVKILVDGIAVSGDIGGSVAVYQIPVEDIDHIEIVQGASSALYGSDAMGGVINIITKKHKEQKAALSGNLTQELSSSIRSYTGGNISFSGEHLSAALTGSFDWSKGLQQDTYTALVGTVSQYLVPYNRLGFLRGSADWTDESGKIGVYGLFSDSLQKTNTTVYETMDYQSDRLEAGVTAEKTLSEAWKLSGFSSIKWYALETNFTNSIYDELTTTDTKYLDSESEIRASWDPNLVNSVLFGFNGNVQTVEGSSFDGSKKQLQLSLFTQDTVNVLGKDTLFAVPGIRFDVSPSIDGSEFLYQLTPKLSLRYNLGESTVFRLSYGMGYKTPTLKQKYWIFLHNYAGGEGNFILYGNPDLKPETSQGFNAGAERKFGTHIKLSVSSYFNFVQNLIDTEITGYDGTQYTRTYVNIGQAITYGGDAALSGTFERLTVKVSYTYTGAKEYSSENGNYIDLPLRVPHRITASAAYMVPVIETSVAANVEWSSPELIDYDAQTYTPDYLMVGATVEKKFGKGKYDVYLRADNILNNLNFIESTAGDTQEEYFGLYNGTVFSIGARLHI